MPTYDYLCKTCGHRFEKFQSITSEPVHVCPKCSKENVTRLMSGGMGLIFKGSGFYITDYKNNKTSTSVQEKTKPQKETKKKQVDTKKE